MPPRSCARISLGQPQRESTRPLPRRCRMSAHHPLPRLPTILPAFWNNPALLLDLSSDGIAYQRAAPPVHFISLSFRLFYVMLLEKPG